MKTYKCQIKDLGLVITGNTPPTKQREYYGDKVPLIKPTDMDLEKRFIGKTEESLSDFGVEKFRTKLLPKNTPCVVTIGTIGKLCMTKEISLCNQAVNSIIVDENRHDSMFVYYLMKMTVPHVKFLSSGTASGRENVSKTAFSSIEVEVPDLPIQRKIAGILSAYDDLIENNTRRIEILEEMARMLYREWFVKFRFPVDDGGGQGGGDRPLELVESELGLIPKGWEVRTVDEVVKRLSSKNQYKESDVSADGLIPVFDQSRSEFLGFHSNKADFEATPDNPIIIFGDHTCKMQLVVEPFSIAPNVIPFIAKIKIPITYLYFLVNSLVETIEYKRHWTEFKNKQVVIASPEIAFKFHRFSKEIFAKIDLLRKKNINLQKTRDLLLPRLISGQIDVEELDMNLGAIEH